MPGTVLGAGDTKMKQAFLLVGLTLPLEALSVVALWRKAKSGEVPQHRMATWQ